MVALTAILAFVGNQANLPFLNPQMALYISGAALFIEGIIEKRTGNALFGSVRPA